MGIISLISLITATKQFTKPTYKNESPSTNQNDTRGVFNSRKNPRIATDNLPQQRSTRKSDTTQKNLNILDSTSTTNNRRNDKTKKNNTSSSKDKDQYKSLLKFLMKISSQCKNTDERLEKFISEVKLTFEQFDERLKILEDKNNHDSNNSDDESSEETKNLKNELNEFFSQSTDHGMDSEDLEKDSEEFLPNQIDSSRKSQNISKVIARDYKNNDSHSRSDNDNESERRNQHMLTMKREIIDKKNENKEISSLIVKLNSEMEQSQNILEDPKKSDMHQACLYGLEEKQKQLVQLENKKEENKRRISSLDEQLQQLNTIL